MCFKYKTYQLVSQASISSDAEWVAQELSLVGWFRLMLDYNKLRVDQGKTEKWDPDQTRDWVSAT